MVEQQVLDLVDLVARLGDSAAAENSYLVYGYSADDGFTLRKEIPVSQWDENNRGLYIGDYFYVVGSDQVNVLDLGTLENVAQAIIPRG